MNAVPATLLAFVSSFAVIGWLVQTSRHPASRLFDTDFSGPQALHDQPVPRVGGIGIALGLWGAAALLSLQDPALGGVVSLLLACALPALLAGLAEDLTKRLGPAKRLAAIALSAGAAVAVSGVVVTRTDLPGLDWVVGFGPAAVAVTVFSVVGVTNAVNLIDGLNGLAAACTVIMLLGLAAIGWRVDDALVVTASLAGVGAVLGFLVWNFPRGLVFLGDGGAYLLGFYVAQVGLLLLHRNPQVSPLFPLLLVLYPVFETVFSMYRRKVLKGRPVGQPDGAHLHSLLFRRCLRSDVACLGLAQRARRNSMTSVLLWGLSLATVLPAVAFWDNSAALAGCGLAFAVVYIAVYRRIVRFRSPRWLAWRTHWLRRPGTQA